MMSSIREMVWARRQARRLLHTINRPSLELVDFGRFPGVVLDVGANLGGFTSQVLVLAPLMTVHCFEPNQLLYRQLEAALPSWGVYGGRPRAVVNRLGVGSITEERQLIVTSMHVASSFLPVGPAARRGWPTCDFNEDRGESVEVIRLDDYLERQQIEEVKLLKLDIQGYELEALRGCGDRLKTVQNILVEVQFQPLYEGAPLWVEIIAYTAKFGFHPVVMDGFCLAPDGSPLQGDILLKRD